MLSSRFFILDDLGETVARFALPTPTPPAAIARSASNQSKDQQEDHCAYERVDYQGDNADAEVNTKSRQEPIADERSNKADHQIANQPKAATSRNLARQVPGNNPNHDDY
jgi:hypothetical protein